MPSKSKHAPGVLRLPTPMCLRFFLALSPQISLALSGVLLSHVVDLGTHVLSHLTLPSLPQANSF